MVLSQIKKRQGVYCCAYGCKEPPQKKKGGLCHKHYKRNLREKDPILVRYMDLKESCKRRGYKVYFSLKEFRFWCSFTGYLKKGRRGLSATIDRRCNIHGYYLWNMQLMSNRMNASKGNRHSGNNFTREHHFAKDIPFDEYPDEEVPF